MSQPTVVLVHGAFAKSASWNGVPTRLRAAGLTAIAVANPLRSLSGDAAHVKAVLDSLEGSVVLVGHSYGGTVITAAARARRPRLTARRRRRPHPARRQGNVLRATG